MKKFEKFTAHYAVLNREDIDTDQIIPARFLKVTTRDGLGKHLFSDWRYHADGSDNESFALNCSEHRHAQILVAGANFGCGSSREHAPWALHDFGIRAVLSTSFGDIFANNALKNGVLPIQVSPEFLAHLLGTDGGTMTIDLEAQTVTRDDGISENFKIESFARYRLLHGIDEFEFLMSQSEAIARYEQINGK